MGDSQPTFSPTYSPTFEPTYSPTSFSDRNPWGVGARDWQSVRWTLVLCVGVAIILVGSFEALRGGSRRVYRPREMHCRGRVPADTPGFFSWLLQVNALKDDELVAMIGLDAFQLLCYLRMCKHIFCVMTALCVSILVPLYKTGDRDLGGFDSYTIINLERESQLLWAPVAFSYALAAVTLYGLDHETRLYVTRRRAFLSDGDGGNEGGEDGNETEMLCSVIVENIPRKRRGDRELAGYFREVVGPVHSAVVFLKLTKLERLAARQETVFQALERSFLLDEPAREMRLCGDDNGCPVVKRGVCCSRPYVPERLWLSRELAKLDADLLKAQQDALAVCSSNGDETSADKRPLLSRRRSSNRLVTLARRLADLAVYVAVYLGEAVHLSKVMEPELAISSTGVCTFASPGDAAAASQLQLSGDRYGVSCELAPSRLDLVWANVGKPELAIARRKRLVDKLLLGLALLWAPLIGLIQVMSNLEKLAKVVPILRPLARRDKYEFERSVITGLLPVLLLLGLMALMPIILRNVAVRYIGLKSWTRIDQRYVLQRNLYFHLLSIFVTVLAGSVARVFKHATRKPSTLYGILGSALPSIGVYFMELLIVKAVFSTSWELARVPALIYVGVARCWRKRCCSRGIGFTASEKNRVFEPPSFPYGNVGAQIVMVTCIGSLYAAIAPLVLVPCAAYFVVAEAVYTRQFLSVYVKLAEAGALHVWPTLVKFTVISLVLSNLTVMSFLFLRTTYLPATLMLPLVFIPIALHSHLNYRWIKPARRLDRETALRGKLLAPDFNGHLDPDHYRQPALTAPPLAPAIAEMGSSEDGDAGDEEEEEADNARRR